MHELPRTEAKLQPAFREPGSQVLSAPSFEGSVKRAKTLVYEPEFDRQMYRAYSGLSPEDQRILRQYTTQQVETYVGERLGVVESRIRWNIVEGKIIPEGVDTPLETIIANGVNWRRSFNENGELNGNPVDFTREEAEYEGFLKSQARLTDPETPVGAIDLSVSPPGGEGSDYKHKFFDVRVVKEDASGTRYIEATRFLSDLNVEGYREQLAPVKEFAETPTPEDFLKDPIVLDGIFSDASEVGTYLSGGVRALEVQRFAEIKSLLRPYIISYINSLINNPYAILDHNLRLNAIVNEADAVHDAQELKDHLLLRAKRHFADFAPSSMVEQAVQILGRQRVRQAVVPCPGESGGLDVGGDPNLVRDPFSVGDFGKPPMSEVEKAKKDPNLCKCLGKDNPHFHCPGKTEAGKKCESVIIVGQGVSRCLKCGEGKKC